MPFINHSTVLSFDSLMRENNVEGGGGGYRKGKTDGR